MLVDCLASYYHPTEIIFLDDSEVYLCTLELFLQESKFPVFIKTFSDIDETLSYIESKQDQGIVDHLLKRVDTFQINNYALSVDLFDLHKIIYNASRFSQLSAVIVDYDLNAKETGIEFCKRISNKNVQKILFTGQSDQNLVIQAFNEGVIQKFVHKQEVDSLEKILKVLEEAQKDYFNRVTKVILDAVGHRSQFPLAIYCSQFQTFFYNLLDTYNILEYYLLDPVGSYLLLDADKVARILFVQNEDQHKANLLDLKDEIVHALPEGIVEALYRGEYIICDPSYIDGVKRNLPLSNYVVPAISVRDAEEGTVFYCALTKDTFLCDMNKYVAPKFSFDGDGNV